MEDQPKIGDKFVDKYDEEWVVVLMRVKDGVVGNWNKGENLTKV